MKEQVPKAQVGRRARCEALNLILDRFYAALARIGEGHLALAPCNSSNPVSEEVESFIHMSDESLFLRQFHLQFVVQHTSRFVPHRISLFPSAANKNDKVSGGGELHPSALAEPDMNLSTHPAPVVQPWPRSNDQ